MKLKDINKLFGYPFYLVEISENGRVKEKRALTYGNCLVSYELYPESMQKIILDNLPRAKADESDEAYTIHFPSGDLNIPKKSMEDEGLLLTLYFQRASYGKRIKDRLR